LQVVFGLSADPTADLKRADELASKALALDPNYGWARAMKASILLTQGHPDQAIAEAERALALNPAISDAYSSMGFAYLSLGQFEKSLEYFDKAMRLSPHDPGLYFWHAGKALAYNGLKQFDQAIESARRAIAINPSSPYSGYDALGVAYVYTGQFEKSLESCDTAIRLRPSDPGCYRTKAGAYFAMKQYDQAIEWARRTITIVSNDSFAHADILAALALTGHEAEAREALQHFLALPPDAVGMRTIAAWKAYQDPRVGPHSNPAVVDFFDRRIEGLRKAGLPED
jgi:tetratricopeptide (TPR) repeat protein